MLDFLRAWPARCLPAALCGLLGLALGGPVRAGVGSSVALAGTMGDKVVLIVDGRTRVVPFGSTVDGLRVQRAGGQSVVVDAGGARQTLSLGAAPVTLGSAGVTAQAAVSPVASSHKLVMQAGPDSLFHAAGEINGQMVQGVVDTGATLMVLSTQLAQRLGIDWKSGQPAEVQTAASVSMGRRIRLAQVALGSLQARDVDAVVIEGNLPYVLYGNSFLQGFKLQWEQGRLSLAP